MLLLRAHELAARAAGHRLVAGVDEAGVGALAGPVVAAAVILPTEDAELAAHAAALAADSKTLHRTARRQAFQALVQCPGLHWSCAAVPAHMVDRLGGPHAAVDQAMCLAASRLARRLPPARETPGGGVYHLIDGERVPSALSGHPIVRGDATEAAIAAASIIATVAHEDALLALARRWQHWELDINLGWPSHEHMERILEHGPSGCHRASCFPFQRRHGRRLAYHPHRAVYHVRNACQRFSGLRRRPAIAVRPSRREILTLAPRSPTRSQAVQRQMAAQRSNITADGTSRGLDADRERDLRYQELVARADEGRTAQGHTRSRARARARGKRRATGARSS